MGSSIDAKFRWSRERQATQSGTESPGIHFYQRILSGALASHCRYFPSDSAAAQHTFRRCGQWVGISRSMARSFLEADIHGLGFGMIRQGGELKFV